MLCIMSDSVHPTTSIRETGNRGTEMCLRRIPELLDERMVLERLLDDPALNTFATSVNQPHFAKAGFMRGADILDDDRRNIAWRERVKIDRVFYWDFQCQFPTPTTQRPTTPNFKLPTPNNAQGVRWDLGRWEGLEVGSWEFTSRRRKTP